MSTKKTTKKKPAAKKTTTKRKPAKNPAAPWKPKTRALMLRTCKADMTGHGGFKWPRSGYVEAPDWNPAAVCGGGLHGLLWGEGDHGYYSIAEDAVWMVVEVDTDDVVSIDADKVKVPRGNVVFAGQRHEATAFLTADPGAVGKCCHYGTATAGDHGTATAGDHGTATAGDHGTATAGYRGTATAGHNGTATAGYRGTATAGDRGTATAGDHGTATAGYNGTATAGHNGTATAGYRGTATAGDRGTATAGDHGTATAGYRGTATAGDHGTATAGYRGTVSIRYYDPKRDKYRVMVAEVGEGGIKPNTAYHVVDGKLTEKPKT